MRTQKCTSCFRVSRGASVRLAQGHSGGEHFAFGSNGVPQLWALRWWGTWQLPDRLPPHRRRHRAGQAMALPARPGAPLSRTVEPQHAAWPRARARDSSPALQCHTHPGWVRAREVRHCYFSKNTHTNNQNNCVCLCSGSSDPPIVLSVLAEQIFMPDKRCQVVRVLLTIHLFVIEVVWKQSLCPFISPTPVFARKSEKTGASER